jgi:phosphoribosylaminoimidazolecarboxamide formyltransferase/IMP cyclohydrolase
MREERKLALLSVSNKERISWFANELCKRGFTILATKGTAEELSKHGISHIQVSEHTGREELFDDRVKTLDPKIFGGIIFKRRDQRHQEMALQHGIEPIDLVVCIPYPLPDELYSGEKGYRMVFDSIDVGGMAMILAAVKNYPSVTLVTDQTDYGRVLEELDQFGRVSISTVRQFLIKALAGRKEMLDRLLDFIETKTL